ncbi:MAG: hypothetical protein E4H02_11735 [Lentisphaerales bacterium]|nr:MAG: hypothetical protein E4H02_11735 [Lentisphaerales bacterium]
MVGEQCPPEAACPPPEWIRLWRRDAKIAENCFYPRIFTNFHEWGLDRKLSRTPMHRGCYGSHGQRLETRFPALSMTAMLATWRQRLNGVIPIS